MDVVALQAAKADAKKRFARRPLTMVVFGDSLTEQGGEIPVGDAYGVAHSAPGAPRANPDTRVFSAWPWANVLLSQAFTVLANYGIGGETTTQIKSDRKSTRLNSSHSSISYAV